MRYWQQPDPGWGFMSSLSSGCGSQSLEEEESEMFCLDVFPYLLFWLLTWGCQPCTAVSWDFPLEKCFAGNAWALEPLGQLRAAGT